MPSASDLMFHRVDLQKSTNTKDAVGGIKRTWSDFATNVPANVQPISAAKTAEFLKNDIDVTHVVYFDADPKLSNGNRIVFGTVNLEVTGGPADQVSQGVVWRVDANEVRK